MYSSGFDLSCELDQQIVNKRVSFVVNLERFLGGLLVPYLVYSAANVMVRGYFKFPKPICIINTRKCHILYPSI